MSARKVRARIFQGLMILSLAISMGVLVWLLVATAIGVWTLWRVLRPRQTSA